MSLTCHVCNRAMLKVYRAGRHVRVCLTDHSTKARVLAALARGLTAGDAARAAATSTGNVHVIRHRARKAA